MLTLNDFTVGDVVYFGRPRGEKSKGKVVKKNRKNMKVELLEPRGDNRGSAVGSVWTVPPSLCTLEAPNPVPFIPTTPPFTPTQGDFNEGDRVYFGRANGEKTLGEVVKKNPKKLKIKVLEARGKSKVGDTWNVPPSLCTLESKGRPAQVTRQRRRNALVW